MALSVHSAIHVCRRALNERATCQIETRDGTASEFLMGVTDTSVEHEHRDTCTFIRTLVGTNALQIPERSLRIGPQFWDGMHRTVELNILDRAVPTRNDCFEVTLCATHLEEGHSPVTWMTGQFASTCGHMAHLLDLSIGDIRIHNQHPILLGTELA